MGAQYEYIDNDLLEQMIEAELIIMLEGNWCTVFNRDELQIYINLLTYGFPEVADRPEHIRLLEQGVVRREVIPLIAEQSAILSIQNVSTLMCISGNGFVQSSENNEV